jgi:filamentous hemagglutinin
VKSFFKFFISSGIQAVALTVSFLTVSARSQIVAYRNAPTSQQPTVLQTANGLPQVNIQTPNASGVSVNIYSQFDVSEKGIILNNSRANTQTQLAGWVQANPWLSSKEAKVILNQVSSNFTTALNGYIEVAGQQAEVVLANPSGINISGGGFINANAATLTTGIPLLNATGAIDAYQMSNGNIRVDGLGFDLSKTNSATILTRALQVNAGIWANQLNVRTGANQTPDQDVAPKFSLDVSQIGGMYANQIYLTGTEAGLGVRNAGVIAAINGDLVLNNDGWLIQAGTIQAAENLKINTNLDAVLSGKNSAGQTLSIQAGNVDISGSQTQANSLSISSTRQSIFANNSNISVSGQLVFDAKNSIETNFGKINANEVSFLGGNLNNRSGEINANLIKLDFEKGYIDNATGKIFSQKNLSVVAQTESGDGELISANDLQLNLGKNYSIAPTGIVSAGNSTTIFVNGVLTNRGLIDGVNTSVKSTELINKGTGRIYGDHLLIQTNILLNTNETINDITQAATIAAREKLNIEAKNITNSEHALIYSLGDVSIDAELSRNHQASEEDLSLLNASASIHAGNNLTIEVNKIFNANNHFSYETQELDAEFMRGITEYISPYYYRMFDRHVFAPVIVQNDPGQIIAGGNISLSANTISNQQSRIIAGGDLIANAGSIENSEVIGEKRFNDVGTQWSWSVVGGHSDCWPCRWVLDYGIVPSTYNVNSFQTARVSAGIALNHAAPNLFLDSNATTAIALPSVSRISVSGWRIPSLPDIRLPNNSLFQLSKNEEARFLIETDPAFTDQKKWLSSDYLVSLVGLDPGVTQKRLGDGFYEQQLVRQQIENISGRKFLDGFTSDAQVFETLLNQGAAYAQEYKLRPGIALTESQVANLTTSIVWLQEEVVVLPDGSTTKAQVPRLYFKATEKEFELSGTLLSGNQVHLVASKKIDNGGSIFGGGYCKFDCRKYSQY